MLSDHKDFLTAKGARAIADHINTFWREQGVAGIVAYPVQRLGSDGEWDVRSNMVDGRAPKVKQSVVVVNVGAVSQADAKRISDVISRQMGEPGHRYKALP